MSNLTSALGDKTVVYLPVRDTGAKNYIAEGMKLTPNGLSVDISPGIANIERSYQEITETLNQSLEPRMVSLVYAQKTVYSDCPMVGKVNAVFPEPDNNTVAQWRIDGSSTIPNYAVGKSAIAVANNLTKVGTVNQVDGWIGYAGQGDGSTGYYTSANSTGFPAGANAREIDILLKINAINIANQSVWFYGTAGTANYSLYMRIENARLKLSNASSVWDTGFDVELGKEYIIVTTYDGVTLSVYINGYFVYSVAITLATVNSVFYILNIATLTNGLSMVDFVEIRNSLRTPAQISEISSKLLLPNRYYPDASKPEYTDIRSILPTNSISLGFIRTSSTAVTTYNDTDHQYGRREGATGGNRKVFLGWKSFSGSTTLIWDNPFDTRKIKTYYTWAKDANGANECDVVDILFNVNNYGILPTMTSSNRISITTQPMGVVQFNGAWQTSGYIGCYAEVIE
jgi:hypothetical protein